MPRALLVAALGAPLLAWSWMRLESGHDAGQATVVIVLAIAAALVRPRRARIASSVVALLATGAIAFGLGPVWALPGRILSRFGSGFLEFYDYQVPFDPATHPRMHGVLLVALFAFTLGFALAVAARRPGLAAMALVVGVGWPGTLLPGHDLLRGMLLLVTVLGIAAVLRHGPVRGLGAALAAGALIVVAALAATSSPAFAKPAFLDWQHWDPYTKPSKPIAASFVWNSDYRGLTSPGKPTTVLRVKAGPDAHYWRISVLNTVENGNWFQEVSPEFGDPQVPLGQPELVPPRERRQSDWEKQHVTIEALRDRRLPGGSVPVRFRAGDGVGDISYDPTGVAIAEHPLSRGDTYDVWSYAPTPTPAQLAASKPDYSGPIVTRDEYREVQPRVYPHLFGKQGRAAYVRYLMTRFARADQLRRFSQLQGLAEEVAGGARSPYAAAVALEQWFRFGGGFIYDQHPPKTPAGVAPLENFVAHTRRGYCQHFAGAMALMLRYLGIPSRVAVGFASGRYQHGEWVVTDHDAHMWVEVWFRGWGWVPFDPTPGRGGLSGGYSASSKAFDAAAAAFVLAGKQGLPSFARRAVQLGFKAPPVHVSPDVPDLSPPKGAAATAQHHSRAPGLLRLLFLVLGGLVAAIALVKLGVRRSRYLTHDPRRLAAAARRELRDILRDQLVDVPDSATLEELGVLVEKEFGVDATAFGLHASAARFGPAAGARDAAREMRRSLRGVRRGIRAELTRLDRARGLLSLRSLGLA